MRLAGQRAVSRPVVGSECSLGVVGEAHTGVASVEGSATADTRSRRRCSARQSAVPVERREIDVSDERSISFGLDGRFRTRNGSRRILSWTLRIACMLVFPHRTMRAAVSQVHSPKRDSHASIDKP